MRREPGLLAIGAILSSIAAIACAERDLRELPELPHVDIVHPWPENRVQPLPRAERDSEAIYREHAKVPDRNPSSLGAWPPKADPTDAPIRPQRWRTLAEPSPGVDGGERGDSASFIRRISEFVAPPIESAALPDSVSNQTSTTWTDVAIDADHHVRGPLVLATTTVDAGEDGVWMAKLQGAATLFVNGAPFQGDPERRGYEGVPIALPRGENRVFVADAPTGFEFELWKPPSRLVIAWWDMWFPRNRAMLDTDDYDTLTALTFNASLESYEGFMMHFSRAVDAGSIGLLHGSIGNNEPTPPLCLSIRDDLLPMAFTKAQRDFGPGSAAVALCFYVDQEDADRRVITLRANATTIVDRPIRSVKWRELRRVLSQPRYEESSGGSHFKSIVLRRPVIVYGTRGSAELTNALLALARFWQQRLWYECDLVPLVVSDSQFQPDPHRGATIALGDATSNSAYAVLCESIDPFEPSVTGCAIGIQPETPNGPAVLVRVDSSRQALLAAAIDPFFDPTLQGNLAHWPETRTR